MIALFRTLIIVYILAINIYGFMLIVTQKRQSEERAKRTIKDSTLLVSALLGGALGIYLALFILHYRVNSLFLMISMPLIIVLNVYILITGFTTNFGFLVQSTL